MQFARAGELAVAVDDERRPPARDPVHSPLAHLAAQSDTKQHRGDRELGRPGDGVEPVKGGAEGGAKARVVRREVGELPVSPVADRLGGGDPRQDRVGDALAEQGVRGRRRVPGEDGAR